VNPPTPIAYSADLREELTVNISAHGRRTHPLDGRKHAAEVVTWGSGAAVKALLWGIRAESHMPSWIAAQDNTDAGRLAMFRRLAWAQWRMSEIANGEAIRRLLEPE
jgi:hypothetical protein